MVMRWLVVPVYAGSIPVGHPVIVTPNKGITMAVSKEEADSLWSGYNAAFKKVSNGGKGVTVREGGVGADAAMGVAWGRLVRAGLVQPLPRKYTRGGRGGARK